jgi:hypothetical protein
LTEIFFFERGVRKASIKSVGSTNSYKQFYIKKEITHVSLTIVEKTSLKDLKKQSSLSLSPPSSQRFGQPPSRMDAGTQPLASKLTLNAVVELEEGLTMEVALPKPFISLRIAPRRTLDAEQLTPTVELVLEEGGFQLQNCWTKDAEDGASPTTTEKNNPPSNSPHLPRAGGDMQRRRARQSSNPAANGACRSRARGFAASRTAEGGAFGGLTQSAMEDGHGVPWRVDMGLDEVC